MSFVGISLLFAMVFLFFFGRGGGEKEQIEGWQSPSLLSLLSLVPSPHSSRASDKEPPVHFGKEKEKNDELAMSLESRQIPVHSTCARI